MRYFDAFRAGLVDEDKDLLDAVDRWHSNYGDAVCYPELHDYLGLTWEEYKSWVDTRKTLADIAQERNNGTIRL